MTDRLHLALLVPEAVPVPAAAPPHRRVAWPPYHAIVRDDAEAPALDGADGALAAAGALASLGAAYAQVGDVLQMAPGAVFSSEAALLRHLDRERSSLAARASAVEGRVEYLVQASSAGPVARTASAGPDATGAAFLRRKRAQRVERGERAADRERAIAELARLLRRHATDVVGLAPGSGGRLAGFAICLPRHGAAAAIDALGRFAGRPGAAGLRVSVTGPYPPMSATAP